PRVDARSVAQGRLRAIDRAAQFAARGRSARSRLARLERAGQTAWRARSPNTRLARRNARLVINAAGPDLSAPSTVRDRHPPHGRAKSEQCRSARQCFATASSRAPCGRRSCASGGGDAIFRHPGDDLPSAKPCSRPRPRRQLAAVVQSRATGFSSAYLAFGRALWRLDYASRADRRVHGAISVFRTGRPLALTPRALRRELLGRASASVGFHWPSGRQYDCAVASLATLIA